MFVAVKHLDIVVSGKVLGHEHQIMQHLQQLLQGHVTLNILPKGSQETAAATVVFKRMKPRLPSDELQALLASVQGTVISFTSPLHAYMCVAFYDAHVLCFTVSVRITLQRK